MNQLAQQIQEDARRREERVAIARKFSNGTPLDVDRGGSFPLQMPDRGAGDARPYAVSADPCPRCATRGALGCAHQKPYQPRSN
ncbi:hypothetical protein [Blastomonas sp. AAP25]|uniref:hypothetical protein n=1 Tax=Blastomonas sp. AAP25 TaxID=1523416 RepID=UPI000A49EEAB|nr:hypothetical protein [Blastomonas sp. AAP25]